MAVSYGPKCHDCYRRAVRQFGDTSTPIGIFSTKTKINSDEDVWLSIYLCAALKRELRSKNLILEFTFYSKLQLQH